MMNVMIRIVMCISKALLLHGAWVFYSSYKTAVDPYHASINSNAACSSLCESDSNCNGYSIDTYNNACYLSRCDTYLDVPSCSTCMFASKSPLSSSPICNPENATGDASVLETVTPDDTTLISEEATTTADIGTSSTSVVLNTIQQDTKTTLSEEPTTADTSTTSVVTNTPFYATTDESTEDIRTTSSRNYHNKGDFKHPSGNVTCDCVCKYTNISVEKSLAKRKKALILNRTKLSSSIRKLISVHDSRVSCRDIGVMGIVVMVIFVLLIFCIDISSLCISVRKKN